MEAGNGVGAGGQKETLLGVMGARGGVQTMFYGVVHLKPVWFSEPMSP